MSAAMTLQNVYSRPSGGFPLAGASQRNGRLADRRGGMGDAVNHVDRPAADISCLACWFPHSAFSFCSFLHHIGFYLKSAFHSVLHHIRHFLTSQHSFLIAVSVFIFVSSGCVSSRQSDSQMLRVLKAEAHLLNQLKEERRNPQLLKSLHRYENVAEAESRLRDAIDALIEANAEMQSAIKDR